jgi:hypothetical protein
VSRFQTGGAAAALLQHGIETLSCDLLDRDAVSRLPAADNVIFMAGQKFGTSGQPEQTWAMQCAGTGDCGGTLSVSADCGVFDGVCVSAAGGDGRGAEDDPLTPPGEYGVSAASVGRDVRLCVSALWYSGAAVSAVLRD